MSVDKALLCYAWDSSEPYTLIDNLGDAKELLLALMNEGMDAEGLLKRISKSRLFADELFLILIGFFRGTDRWPTFVRAVVGAPRTVWASNGGGLSEEVVVRNFLSLLDGASLLLQYRIVESDRSHPLFDRLFADPYWTDRVGHYIHTRDHLRAWEEIKKAKRGVPVSSITPRNRRERLHFALMPSSLCLRASDECQRTLIIRLFEAMVARRLIEPLGGEDYVILRQRSQGVAGMPLAERLGDVTKTVERNRVKYILCRVGGMAVKLAKNFARPGAGTNAEDVRQNH